MNMYLYYCLNTYFHLHSSVYLFETYHLNPFETYHNIIILFIPQELAAFPKQLTNPTSGLAEFIGQNILAGLTSGISSISHCEKLSASSAVNHATQIHSNAVGSSDTINSSHPFLKLARWRENLSSAQQLDRTQPSQANGIHSRIHLGNGY